jgi:hypothetical protein
MAMSSSTRTGTVWLAPFVVAAGLAAGLIAGSGVASADYGTAAGGAADNSSSTPADASPAGAVSNALRGIRSGIRGATAGTFAALGNQGQLLDATKQMQETQMSFNLQSLRLQSQMQHENRSYTAISNIMKTKHDTVKNSIGNIR